jgi:hypothetical protein
LKLQLRVAKVIAIRSKIQRDNADAIKWLKRSKKYLPKITTRFLIPTRILRLEWLEWELMQKKPEGGTEWVMGAKEMDDDFQVVLRGATKDTKKQE